MTRSRLWLEENPGTNFRVINKLRFGDIRLCLNLFKRSLSKSGLWDRPQHMHDRSISLSFTGGLKALDTSIGISCIIHLLVGCLLDLREPAQGFETLVNSQRWEKSPAGALQLATKGATSPDRLSSPSSSYRLLPPTLLVTFSQPLMMLCSFLMTSKV
jgi:hypothetical protein